MSAISERRTVGREAARNPVARFDRAAIIVAVSSIGQLLLTAVHHVYGAVVYNTPWRNHVAFIAIPTALLIAVTLFVASRYAGTAVGRASLWLAVIVIAIVPVAAIGLFEGGYNHLLKDVLYFGGATREVMIRLFPPPAYEMPGDWFFETTGVLQFFVSLPAAYYGYLLWRSRISRRGGAALRNNSLTT